MARGESVNKQEESLTHSVDKPCTTVLDSLLTSFKDSLDTPKGIVRLCNVQEPNSEEKEKRRPLSKKDNFVTDGCKWSCKSCGFLNVASTEQCVICTKWRPRLPRQVNSV